MKLYDFNSYRIPYMKKKILLAMKLSAALLLLTMLQVSASTLAQKKVTLLEKNATLEKVLKAITKQTGYDLVFISTDISIAKPVTINVNKATLDEALKISFSGQPFEYSLDTRTLIVQTKSNNKNNELQVAILSISGRVLDENGQPLPGASVKEVGTSNAAQTNAKGEFKLNVTGPESSLSVSFVGYINQTIKVGEQKVITVRLQPNPNVLKDAVVIGYQTVSRRTSTAAVSTVRAKDIENLPSPSFDQLLQGRVAGVNIQNYSGEPGSRPTFTVRGNTSMSRTVNAANALSSPLFIIDGVPVSYDDISSFTDVTQTNFIAGINPNDIESIDVLKDAASASIYGSRGANGVVVIKTKRGKNGEKPQVNVNFYTGLSTRARSEVYYVGAEERQYKMNYLASLGNYEQLSNLPVFLTDSLNPAFNNNTDWQGLFFQTARIYNADASAFGGSENVNYRLSGNYYNEEGIVKSTGFKRYNLAANMGYKMTPKFNIDLAFRASRTDRSRGRGVIPNPDADYTNPLPISNSAFPSSLLQLSGADSLNYMGQYDLAKDKNINDDISASIALNYEITPNLKFTSQGSLLLTNSSRDLFRPSALDANSVFYTYAMRSSYQNYNLDNTLTYNLTLKNDHHLNFLAGNTINYINVGYSGVGGYGTGNNAISTVNAIKPGNFDPNYTRSSNAQAGLLSFFGRVNYDFKSRYLLSASIRSDASSRFGKNNRWAYFPAVSAGWILSDEAFMAKTKSWIGLLKVRGSFGISGNLPDNFYAPYNSYLVGNGNLHNGNDTYTYNGVTAITHNPGSVTQDNLTWERALQGNIGIDADFFNNRLQVVADLYNRGTKDIFFNLKMPSTSGYDEVFTNSVGVRNIGLEFNISGKVFSAEKSFQWNPRLIMSFNKNQITKLPDGNRDIVIDYNGTTYILSKGRPINEFYQVKSNGVYSTQGDVPFDPRTGDPITYWDGSVNASAGTYRWIDQNGDYDVWDRNDLVRTGDPNPKVTGGFSNTFTYKNFSMEVFTSFSLGRDVYNTYVASLLTNYKQLGSFYTQGLMDLSKLSIWRKPGDVADYADVNPYNSYYYQFNTFSSAYMEDGSYARIKYINLGYRFPAKWLSSVKLTTLQVYGIMDNVYTFQKSNLPDVEAVDALGIYSGNGYPLPRKFTLGLRATF
ncbi:TonB-linked outer membrane protein, SusC/RagA family [Pedobacter nyackensis]|uniref:TonB-linked outer membrane protein, SusC/RagA family n=2 Tax=Pedobacter nyackensis TaxID=475255 RepID=A0A1W2E125_9SPHI|nr:TonB-linked outer membrane protein, SusC/RagA family [Pedobacter nyackensis]